MIALTKVVFFLVLIHDGAYSESMTTIPTPFNVIGDCYAEATRIQKEQKLEKAFCVQVTITH